MPESGQNGNTYEEAFGHRLRVWRSRHALPGDEELTQEELARAVGRSRGASVSKSRISKYENGWSLPNAEFLDALGRAYPACNIDWLLTGRGDPTFDVEYHQATKSVTPDDASVFSETWANIHRAAPAGSWAARAVLNELIPRLYRREKRREQTEVALEQEREGVEGNEEPEPLPDLEVDPDLEDVGPVPVEFVEGFVEEYLRPAHAAGSFGEREAAMLSQLAVAYISEFGSSGGSR